MRDRQRKRKRRRLEVETLAVKVCERSLAPRCNFCRGAGLLRYYALRLTNLKGKFVTRLFRRSRILLGHWTMWRCWCFTFDRFNLSPSTQPDLTRSRPTSRRPPSASRALLARCQSSALLCLALTLALAILSCRRFFSHGCPLTGCVLAIL